MGHILCKPQSSLGLARPELCLTRDPTSPGCPRDLSPGVLTPPPADSRQAPPQALLLPLYFQVPAASDHAPSPDPHFRTCPSPCPGHSPLKATPKVPAVSGHDRPHTLATPLCRLRTTSCYFRTRPQALVTPPVNAAYRSLFLDKSLPTLATPPLQAPPRSLLLPDTPPAMLP